MQSVKYQIVTASTGSTVGQGALAVIKDCRVYALGFRWRASGGAGNGFYSCEATVNNGYQALTETSGPPRAYAMGSATVAVGNGSFSGGMLPPIPVDVPLRAGDILYMNTTQTGTAAASCLLAVDIYCKE